jgi:hypothetical protein
MQETDESLEVPGNKLRILEQIQLKKIKNMHANRQAD